MVVALKFHHNQRHDQRATEDRDRVLCLVNVCVGVVINDHHVTREQPERVGATTAAGAAGGTIAGGVQQRGDVVRHVAHVGPVPCVVRVCAVSARHPGAHAAQIGLRSQWLLDFAAGPVAAADPALFRGAADAAALGWGMAAASSRSF